MGHVAIGLESFQKAYSSLRHLSFSLSFFYSGPEKCYCIVAWGLFEVKR